MFYLYTSRTMQAFYSFTSDESFTSVTVGTVVARDADLVGNRNTQFNLEGDDESFFRIVTTSIGTDGTSNGDIISRQVRTVRFVIIMIF